MLIHSSRNVCEKIIPKSFEQGVELAPQQYGYRSNLKAMDAARFNGIVLLNKLAGKQLLPRFLSKWIQSWLSDRSITARFKFVTPEHTSVLYELPKCCTAVLSLHQRSPS